MSSSRLSQGRVRFDGAHVDVLHSHLNESAAQVEQAVRKSRDYLLAQQHPEGYWLGELQGDTILESEYILLLAWMKREKSEVALQAAEYLRRQQRPEGGWSQYPGGPLEMSVSVKAYFALKLTGHDPASEEMARARHAILSAGGAEKVNSFTRYYLALLGQIEYRQCPVVPPELTLLPLWMPFNIYEMSSWPRTIVVPLSLLWAYQPVRELPEELSIRELFVRSPEELPVTMPESEQLDGLAKRTLINWSKFFRAGDRIWKVLETCRLTPFRRVAIRKAKQWMFDRFADSDGLGAIFPPIVWSIVALRCLGYEDDSPEVMQQLNELDKLMIREGDTVRLEPCRSPVWDTALTTIALREANVPSDHASIRKSVDWLLTQEVRRAGDWSVKIPEVEPGGWCFEFNNEFYPDIDDTIMVTMALARCLPGERHRSWKATLTPTGPQGHTPNAELRTIVTGEASSTVQAVADIERMAPMLAAMQRGVRWVLAMQSRNGGWGAFDANNDRELLTRVPFADHNAMIDPPTADITARTLEMFGVLGINADHAVIRKAIDFVWNEQERDHCWYGRWGVNYIYGTWQVIVGLREIGVPADDPRIRKAVAWFKSYQQADGGWGETPESYDSPELRGQGETTASQTAWALLGLMAGGEVDSDAVNRGIEYLIRTQQEDGTWNEEQFTGTGFPRVFYLRYHMYRQYFPLMALARYQRLSNHF
ncbi:MAG: prenyltransferase/squalene oxidase repeat-containing protein [Planctomycetaceae bacterium]